MAGLMDEVKTYKSADDARQDLLRMQAQARTQREAGMPAMPKPAAPVPASNASASAPKPYDHLSLGQPEPNPNAGSAWRALGRAFLYNSDVDAAERRRAAASDSSAASTIQQSSAASGQRTEAPASGAAGTSVAGDATMPAYDIGARPAQAAQAPAAQPLMAEAGNNISRTVGPDGRVTYSGENIGPGATINGQAGRGGLMSAGVDSGAASARRVAQIYRSMAAGNGAGQGMSVPTVSHSGNDWGARNELRNARISASSMTNQPGYGGMIRGRNMIGGVQGKSAAQAHYESLLAADQAARGANATLAQEGMRQQGGLMQEAARQQGGLMQEAARQRGQLQQAQVQAGTERAKLGLAERQQQEDERNGLVSRARAELELGSARQLDAVRQEMAAATTPEARAAAERRWIALAGDIAGQQNKWRGIELSGGTDAMGNRNPSTLALLNEATGETRMPGMRQPANSPPTITSREAYDALPKGARYIRDGVERIKG